MALCKMGLRLYLLRVAFFLLLVGIGWQLDFVRDFLARGLWLIKRHDFVGIRQMILAYGQWAPLTSIALMTLQSVIPFVPGLFLTLVNAWLFGWQYGALYSWVGALFGAGLDFYLARWFGRPWLGCLSEAQWVKRIEKFLDQQGFVLIFLTRLTPLMPFKVISYSAGLTGLPFSRYLLATATGQTPPILLYSYLGQELQRNWRGAAALTLLAAVFALGLYYWSQRRLRIEENGKK
ncbi:TVP38/TMEM64 family protein [Azotosporobacter soli]|uniref:TVP38/TMEM64 family protein n=1 Tax=Azotosporobacter soli TaxID=3055040 RepID=UPI0031FEBA83